MDAFDPNTLPTDAENYDVDCERCGRVHKYYAMTREGYQRMMREKVKALADEIDRRALAEITARMDNPFLR